jgi:DnaD/phage-associated family protein
MIYRLKEFKGDTIAVPQLVFSKLGIAEEYNVRVALYVLATGVTDPDKICTDLKLRSRISAESALSFWAGAGLLERYEENTAPGEEPSAPAPMTWAEIAAASRTDPMISSLIDCAQTSFARPLTHSDMERLVNLYVQDGYAPETVMLCVAYMASRNKRTMAAVIHELKVWRNEGVETGEQADSHLKLLALRQSREQYVSGLLEIPESELTLGGRKAIARWYEVYGYDDAMVQEAAVQAGAKKDLWYWNSILKTWNAKGLRTIHDVRGPVADAGASRNIRVDREAPSGNDFLGSSSLSASLNRLKKRSNT